jgi:hypothetical protein
MTSEEQNEAIRLMMLDPSTAEICPECGTRIAERERIGRSLYLRPCGHRVGQIDDEGRMLTCTVSLARLESAAVATVKIDATSDVEIQRAALRFAVECLCNGPQSRAPNPLWPSSTYADAIAALERWATP